MLPLQAVPLILISLSLAQAKAMHMWRAMWEVLRLFPLDWRATARRDRLRCWNVPPSLTIPICLGRPRMREGMTEEWRDREREERRQNDGVAIKYTAGSEEHAGCCWEAALWWRISAPSLHFSFFLFWFHSFWTLSCLLRCFFSNFFLLPLVCRHSVVFSRRLFFVFLPVVVSFLLYFPLFHSICSFILTCCYPYNSKALIHSFLLSL